MSAGCHSMMHRDCSDNGAMTNNDARRPAGAADAPAAEPIDACRIDALEIKISFLEDLVDTLNALVARQTDQIEALGRELQRLRDRQGPPEGGHRPPGDEQPPHY